MPLSGQLAGCLHTGRFDRKFYQDVTVHLEAEARSASISLYDCVAVRVEEEAEDEEEKGQAHEHAATARVLAIFQVCPECRVWDCDTPHSGRKHGMPLPLS